MVYDYEIWRTELLNVVVIVNKLFLIVIKYNSVFLFNPPIYSWDVWDYGWRKPVGIFQITVSNNNKKKRIHKIAYVYLRKCKTKTN